MPKCKLPNFGDRFVSFVLKCGSMLVIEGHMTVAVSCNYEERLASIATFQQKTPNFIIFFLKSELKWTAIKTWYHPYLVCESKVYFVQ